MAAASRLILDHEDQLDLLSRSVLTAPADPVAAAKRVGQELRNARELKGAQLGEMSRAVNIHANYLLAIEDGRFEDLPGRAFTIGYVARYARHLGLDVEKIVDRLQGEIAASAPGFDDRLDIVPMPDRNWRVGTIAAALLLLVALTYSRNDIVALATLVYEQVAAEDPAQTVDAPTPAPVDEPAPIMAGESPIPLPARIAVTPSVSLRADLTPAAIEEARIAAIPLPTGISVTPSVSLRADLTPAAIEEARIAAIPLPTGIAVTPPASLRADLTPAAIRERTRVAALSPMPLPTEIAVTPPASRRVGLEPAAIERAPVVEVGALVASSPLPTRISVTPSVSPPADPAQSTQAQLPPGRRLGLGNRNSRITLRAHGPTFVAVRDARSRAFLERPLARGDTYRVPNQAGLRLSARDGGAVEIILDGISLGFAGSRGLETNGLALNPQNIADRLRRF